MADLTQSEQDFFATGVLPPELSAEQQRVLDVPAPAEPAEPAAPANPAQPQQQQQQQQEAPQQQQDDHAETLRRQLAIEQERVTRAEAAAEAIRRQLEARTADQNRGPNPAEDPIGAMFHELRTVNGTVEALKNELTQQQQANLLRQQTDQFVNSVRAIKNEYVKTVPDFDAAYEHVKAIRTADLKMIGIPDAQIPNVLLQDEFNITQSAIQRGENPAAVMYNMAKRYGYTGKAPPPDVPNAQTSAQKVAAIAKGQEAAKQPQKASIDSELTIDSLKDAGNDDLNKVVQDDKLWHRLVGGTSDTIF